MPLFRTALAFTLLLSGANIAHAQDDMETIDTIESVEKVPSKKLQRAGKHMRGPITSLHKAGLLLASFDKNSDYEITQAEFAAGRMQAFKQADTDNSGVIGMFELEDWREKALGSLDAAPGNLAFDKDYNQRVTREEFDAALDVVFKGADKDKNGIIAFSELVHVFEIPSRPVFDEARKRPDGFDQIDRNRRRRVGGY